MASQPAPLTGGKLALVAFALALGTFMMVLDSTIANVSLPTIAGNLGVSSDNSTWVITAFAVANGVAVPLTGWLMGRFGVVRTFCTAVAAFTLSSFLCGIAWDLPSLIVFRILQGACSGPMMPGSQALLISIFPSDKRSTALGVWSMTTLVGPVMGPILGGYISDNYHWSWIFLINVPFGIFALWMTQRRLRLPVIRRHTSIDRLGAALLDLAHQVPAHPLRLHPRERLDRRPVAAQAHLDEVAPGDRARLDQATHRRAVAVQRSVAVWRRVGVCVEVHDADALRPAEIGDRRRIRPCDGVVSSEHDRDRAGRGHLADLPEDLAVPVLDATGNDRRIARVDRGDDAERVDSNLQRVQHASLILRLANGAWAEARPRPMGDRIVERRADDRHIRPSAPDLGRVFDPGELRKGDRTHVRRPIVSVAVLLGSTPPEGGKGVGKRGLGCAHVFPPKLPSAAGSSQRPAGREWILHPQTLSSSARVSAASTAAAIKTATRSPLGLPSPTTRKAL